MIARKLGFMILAAVTFLTLLGCQHSASTNAENPQNDFGTEKSKAEGKPKIVRQKVDENQRLFRLLMADAVRKDLELTADQIGKIDDAGNDLEKQFREFKTKFPSFAKPGQAVGMSKEDLEKFQADIRDWQKRQKDFWAQVVAILTPSQSERLRQIQLQQSIAESLSKPDLVKELELSQEQLAKIRLIADREEQKQLEKSREFESRDHIGHFKTVLEYVKGKDKAVAEENKLALDVLTPEQRKKLGSLWGKEIEVTWNYEAELAPNDLISDVPSKE